MKTPLLFHRDIFFPEDLLVAFKQRHLQLEYSPNAREHSKHDGFPIRHGLTITWSNILEVGSINYLKPSESVQSIVVREPLDDACDIVFTIRTDLRSGRGVVHNTFRAMRTKPHYSARLSEYICS